MKKLLLLPAALLVLAGCGSETAEDAANNIVSCMNDEDYSCVVEYMSDDSLKQIEQQLDRMRAAAPMKEVLAEKLEVSVEEFDNMTSREFAAKMLEQDMEEADNATMSVEKVEVSEDGNSATITTVRAGDSTKLPLKKVEDKWYINN